MRDKDENGSIAQEKEYHVYSTLFANHSKFIDTSLAVAMKEKGTKVIILNDVKPEVFDNAVKYLEDPVAGERHGCVGCFGRGRVP